MSLGVTDPVHVSHISGFKTSDLLPGFEELGSEKKIIQLPYKIGRKYYYIHQITSRILLPLQVEEECVTDSPDIHVPCFSPFLVLNIEQMFCTNCTYCVIITP